MTSIPENPDAQLTRHHLATALTQAGYPISPATLATKACRGGGPPYQLFGPRALYRWGPALDWARGRLSEPRCSSSERDVLMTEIDTVTTSSFDTFQSLEALVAPCSGADQQPRRCRCGRPYKINVRGGS